MCCSASRTELLVFSLSCTPDANIRSSVYGRTDEVMFTYQYTCRIVKRLRCSQLCLQVYFISCRKPSIGVALHSSNSATLPFLNHAKIQPYLILVSQKRYEDHVCAQIHHLIRCITRTSTIVTRHIMSKQTTIQYSFLQRRTLTERHIVDELQRINEASQRERASERARERERELTQPKIDLDKLSNGLHVQLLIRKRWCGGQSIRSQLSLLQQPSSQSAHCLDSSTFARTASYKVFVHNQRSHALWHGYFGTGKSGP